MATTPLVTEAFYATAPIHFQVSRVIAASPDEVFAALADTPSWPQWFTPVSSASWTSEAPYGVGSTREVKSGPVTIKEEFIVWEPGKRWGFSIVGTTVPVVKRGAELVELVADGHKTRVTYHMHLEPFPFVGGLVKLARPGVEKGLADGLKGLAKHLAKAA